MDFSTTASAPAAEGLSRREHAVYRWTFWGLLAAFEVFLFTMPVMPTGDGPVHIYLSRLMWTLVKHTSPLYEHFYAIRHLVQPYSFHYYFLIVLERWFSADRAEELFVALILATLAIGFRRLCQVLGPGSPSVSLWVFPLLLSWPLGGGFLNYVFACGLLLFALVYYVRLTSTKEPGGAFAGLLTMLVLLVLSHPVPILLLIFLIGVDIVFQSVQTWRGTGRLQLPRWSLGALGLSCLAFLFPLLIADKAQDAGSLEHGLGLHLAYLPDLLDGCRVSLFDVQNPLGWFYGFAVVAMVPICVVLLLRSRAVERWRAGSPNAADRLALGVLLYLLCSLFFPPNMNGSALFAVRMFYMVWLVAAPCAAYATGSRTAQRAIAVSGVLVALLSLTFASLYLRPLAHKQWQIEHASLPSHARGLFLQTLAGDSPKSIRMNDSLLFWQGARAFADHGDVLLNTPWLQLTIVPVVGRAHSGLLDNFVPNSASEDPNTLAHFLEKHPAAKANALVNADFLLLSDPSATHPEPLVLAKDLLGPATPSWHCTQQHFYAVCTRQ
jgi:hypothetical protein